MPDDFQSQRLAHLRQLLQAEYTRFYKLQDKRSEAELANQVPIEMQIEKVLTDIRAHEAEFADALLEQDIPEDQAQQVLPELEKAVKKLESASAAKRDANLAEVLAEIRAKLSAPNDSDAGKLRLAIPIIPGLVTMEAKLDLGATMRTVWGKIKTWIGG
jgi:hypothetical protein